MQTIFHDGEINAPLIVFIHGMGMNQYAWSEPSKARILGGMYPLSVLLGINNEMETSFSDVAKLGLPVLTWSQSRPAGPIEVAVDELKRLIEKYGEYSEKGVVFVCHSRGGLIARKFLEKYVGMPLGLITLGAPHHGTNLARLALYLSPLARPLNHILEGFGKKEADTALRRTVAFLGGKGIRELLPGSRFYSELKDSKSPRIKYISIGGTSPDLLRAVSLSLPELIASLLPGRIIHEEMRPGHGDGLVSALSAESPHADEHRNFSVNHVEMLCDNKVRSYVLESVKSIV